MACDALTGARGPPWPGRGVSGGGAGSGPRGGGLTQHHALAPSPPPELSHRQRPLGGAPLGCVDDSLLITRLMSALGAGRLSNAEAQKDGECKRLMQSRRRAMARRAAGSGGTVDKVAGEVQAMFQIVHRRSLIKALNCQ